jgi:F-type H+-transporting ATPase subunit b
VADIDFDPGLQLWSLFTFIVLLLVLARFAFKPLKKALAEREAFIKDTLEKAKQAQSEAERALAENARQTAEAREAIRRSLDSAKNEADGITRKANEQARIESRAIIEQARADIDNQVAKGMDKLKSTVADVSLQVARQVIKENLDEKRHAALVDEFVDLLKKKHDQPAFRE